MDTHPDSIAAWAARICGDDSISETGPIKPRARQVMELIDSIEAQDRALGERADEIKAKIARLEGELGRVIAESVGLAGVLRQMRGAPAEPLAKATRRRKAEAPDDGEALPAAAE